jgi:two-component system sensor histidine kinase CpxA
LAVALLSSALLCLVLARYIAGPIRTLQAVAGRIADGDLSVRVSPAIAVRNDELADLARDFDRMADAIQSLVKKQQELLGEVSHELRSPLTRLNVSLELVRRGDVDASERMQTDLDRLDGLISQILTLTRLRTHCGQRAAIPVKLRPLLESVAEDASFEGTGDGKSVVISHVDECWLRGDPTLLRSCFENVVRNGIRYTKPNTVVNVSLEILDNGTSSSAHIIVADNGEGVPHESLGHLFEPFFKTARPLGSETDGTGLGLSIAQRIVVLHGGSIRARNRRTGGLELEIHLPANRTTAEVFLSEVGFTNLKDQDKRAF